LRAEWISPTSPTSTSIWCGDKNDAL
jgi:hypothetical protein